MKKHKHIWSMQPYIEVFGTGNEIKFSFDTHDGYIRAKCVYVDCKEERLIKIEMKVLDVKQSKDLIPGKCNRNINKLI